MKYLILVFMLIGCAKQETQQPVPPGVPFITKGAILYPSRIESTPIVFNGVNYDIVSNRQLQGTGISIEIYESSQLFHSIPSTLLFISAIVNNGTVYVYGTQGESNGNSIYVLSSTDLVTWTTPVKVLTSGSTFAFFNTSVAPDPTGFVMASEQCWNGQVCFSVHFYHSTDLMNWTEVGSVMTPGVYNGCPTVRYSNGYYYVPYLYSYTTFFVTMIARSADLTHWQYSTQVVLSPDSTEGVNTSDLDLVELPNHTVKILYMAGDQTVFPGSFENIKEATYSGTLSQFFEEFFP